MLAVLTAAAACGDSGSELTAPGRPRQAAAVQLGIAIGADANPVSVARGGSATVNVRVARLAGFTGAVTLGVDTAGMARGLRVSIANATIAAGDTAARAVTITADSTAAASATPMMVRITASGAGVTSQTLLLGVVVTTQTPGFTVSLAGGATSATVTTGQAGTVRVVLGRQGGFTGPVAFTVDSAALPAGLRVTQGAVAGDTVTFNVNAGSTVAAGRYAITLRGTGTGVGAQSVTIPLTVQPVGTFTLGAGSSIAVTAAPGGSVVVPVRINRQGGFAGRIAFLTAGAPAGLTVTADTTTTTDSIANVRVAVPAGTAAGTYSFTLRGISAGLGEQTATIVLTVAPGGTTGSGFTFGPASFPLLVASGATTTVQLPITRTGGFSDSLTITTTGAPAGLTIGTTTVSGTGSMAMLTLTTTEALAAGTYPITVTATGPGGRTQTLTTSITVLGNNQSFGFAFQAPQAAVTVPVGGSTTAPLTVVRIASLAPYGVAFVQNVPRGLTVTLDRNEFTTSTTLTATITASADARPGTYAITFTGATERGPIPPVTMTVQVTAAGTTTVTTGSAAGAGQ